MKFVQKAAEFEHDAHYLLKIKPCKMNALWGGCICLFASISHLRKYLKDLRFI